MPERERLDRLEDGLRKTQDSMLLMSKDIHQMNQSIGQIASSMKTLVEVQQDMKLLDERYETRHTQLKDADKLLHSRLDTLSSAKVDIEKKAEKGNSAYAILLFIGKTLGYSSLVTFFGLMLYLIKMKG